MAELGRLDPSTRRLVPRSGPAFRHQGTCGDPIPVDGRDVDYWSFTNFCFPYNPTGQPSVVLPVGFTDDGLPIGIQVIGRRWDDMHLLATAAALGPFAGGCLAPPMSWL